MVSISVCMIVKNEERVLGRCLDSLCGIYDELIIVDTGSTDATKQIAAKYTDKLFDYEWADDFSAARNFSLSKAVCDYIYVADADEVLDFENRRRFMTLKQALWHEVEVVEMAYVNQSFNNTSNFKVEYRPKLFLRLRPFRYTDPIHEALSSDPIVFRSDVAVNHCPISNHAGRDLNIFAKLTGSVGKLSQRLEMMYARELLIAGTVDDFRAARHYFEARLANPEGNIDSTRRAACVLARLAVMESDSDMLLRVTSPALLDMPPTEIYCALGDYFLAFGENTQAAVWYNAALSGAMPELVAESVGRQPLRGMAACFKAAGDTEKAAYYEKEAAAWKPENLFGANANLA